MIEIAEARALLKRAMESKGPDFVYNKSGDGSCSYDPEPNCDPADPRHHTGCLIGVALNLTGRTEHHNYPSNVEGLAEDFPTMMSKDTVEYFQTAQLMQDGGSTWGRAYEEAEAWWLSHAG